MFATSPTLIPEDIPETVTYGDLWDFAELSLQRTAEALRLSRVATPQEISQAIGKSREKHAVQKPSDLIEMLARVQGHGEESISRAITEIGDQVAGVVSPYAAIIPFAGKLIAPSAFYDSFDQVHTIAGILSVPVIYAEDTDSIGCASINPVACSILCDEIRTHVSKRFGIRPFTTISRLDYESWAFLTRKHFGT